MQWIEKEEAGETLPPPYTPSDQDVANTLYALLCTHKKSLELNESKDVPLLQVLQNIADKGSSQQRRVLLNLFGQFLPKPDSQFTGPERQDFLRLIETVIFSVTEKTELNTDFVIIPPKLKKVIAEECKPIPNEWHLFTTSFQEAMLLKKEHPDLAQQHWEYLEAAAEKGPTERRKNLFTAINFFTSHVVPPQDKENFSKIARLVLEKEPSLRKDYPNVFKTFLQNPTKKD
jgi:hypothetical protein